MKAPLFATATALFSFSLAKAEKLSCSPDEREIIIRRSSCDPNNSTLCAERCAGLHGGGKDSKGDDFLKGKCCIYAGKKASFLAFEEDTQWIPRIKEFENCTGARVTLEYLEDGEDGMADALLADVGDSQNRGGEGMFDAYIVQGKWIPDVAENLADLSHRIREDSEVIKFTDINQASRNAVTYNGTVRALPLDTDYIALGWREDSFAKHKIGNDFGKGRVNDMVPPATIDDLAELAEYLNHKDHNNDKKGDWGICLTPQVNYFYAFVAPIYQTHLKDQWGGTTGQNIFFDADTFKPLIRFSGFKKAVMIYYRIILASNCQTQIANGAKCDRKTAFRTGRCPMVVSMPGTLTKMLLPNASYAPEDRLDGWSVQNQTLLNNESYWGRRSRFPGSKSVQSWNKNNDMTELVPCQRDICPSAGEDLVNYAPYFPEGGEAYALSGRSSTSMQSIMWDMFAWLSTLPIDKLPLSGHYRNSHLSDSTYRDDLENRAKWPKTMINDLFDVLSIYFESEEEGGNPVQDLFVPGFSDYMNALDDELHVKLFNIGKKAYEAQGDEKGGGLFNRTHPASSIKPQSKAFDAAYEIFINNLEQRYDKVTKEKGGIEQLIRWRQSLNLPWKDKAQLCKTALQKDPVSFFERLNCLDYADIDTLCRSQSNAKILRDYGNICGSNDDKGLLGPILISLAVLSTMAAVAGFICVRMKKSNNTSIWEVQVDELHFDDPPVIVGRGTFGLVLRAQYRGTLVAVKRVIPPLTNDNYAGKNDNSGEYSTTNKTISAGGSDSGSGNLIRRPILGAGDPRRLTNETDSVNISKSKQSKIKSGFMTTAFRTIDNHEKLKTDFISEMHHLSTLRHPNITTVMGAVIDKKAEPMLVMEYMDYGSLYDVLHNDTMPFEGDLLLPILRDIAQGIRFLHAADPQVIHGDLKAANILIDCKFRAKVADFGLSMKREAGATGTPFWMAPELLRGEGENTAASDVYSFGIILYEIYARKDPYNGERLSVVINGVKDKEIMKRPSVPSATPPMVATIMNECLLDDPQARPTFTEMDLRLKRLSAASVEPGDTTLSVRTQRNFKEKRAETLLYDVFPPYIADALRDGRKVDQEHHECVTIFFSDIVGFTTISQMLTPEKVCNLLDRLYLRFDEISRKHDVFKIETIGDAYMAITNLVKDQTNNHVKILAEFSRDTIKAAQETQIDVDDISKGFVEIRVGFHSGSVISDVVGSRLPKFGVFGDTVNTASRMESNSLPGCIHCSESSAKLLKVQAPDMYIESRGKIMIKGKGEMDTYWVEKEKDSLV